MEVTIRRNGNWVTYPDIGSQIDYLEDRIKVLENGVKEIQKVAKKDRHPQSMGSKSWLYLKCKSLLQAQ